MNLLLSLSYDGTQFYGWQVQDGRRTVQGELEAVLADVLGRQVRVCSAGRTDAGVHARRQYCNFFVDKLVVPLENLSRVINDRLPGDISLLSIRTVPSDFHARFSAQEKIYRYYFYISNTKNVFLDRYAVRVDGLEIEPVQSAINMFSGERDYSVFACVNDWCPSDNSYLRTVTVRMRVLKRLGVGYIELRASGFLYKMARRIVGLLLEINRGRFGPSVVKDVFSGQKPEWQTAPARGLFLWDVRFGVENNA